MPHEGSLPGTRQSTPQQIVIHVDMDCFYASCERLREPELRGEPVVVGMGYEDGKSSGAVATASYEAREYGVESAQPISQALERLPRRVENPPDTDTGYYRPVDMEFYQRIASDVKGILHELADTVREVSIDEAYLDVTERTSWEVVEGFARHIKHRIKQEVGVPASVGVAPNMSAAKLASDFDKPDGLVVVSPEDLESFLNPIPIEDLHGVGPVSASEFHELDIETIGDLADADLDTIQDRFGDRGRELHRRARGIDHREVETKGKPKSLSKESSFGDPVEDLDIVRDQIEALARTVSERARQKNALYRTIGIKVVTPPFDVNTRAKSLSGPIDDPQLVKEIALDLIEEFDNTNIRKVGVRVSNLSFSSNEQAELETWEGNTPEDTDETTNSGKIKGQLQLENFDFEK